MVVIVIGNELYVSGVQILSDRKFCSLPYFQEEAMYFATERENRKRREELATACQGLDLEETERFRALLNQDHKLLYCRVNKCASTFVLGLLDRVLNCGRHCLREQKDTIKQLPFNSQFLLLKNAYSFIFVREPYGRFFSYYSNRFYATKEQWPRSASEIIKKFRKNPSEVSLKYGHDLSFTEFILYVIDGFYSDDKENEHVRPMHFNCNPCQLNYDFIGKLETLPSDINFLLHQWKHLNLTHDISDDVVTELLNDHLFKPVDNLFSAIKDFKGSPIPVYNLLVRTWTYYQIREKVSKKILLPFSKAEAEQVTKNQYIDKLTAAMERSKGMAGLKSQKMAAMRQAYSSMPPEILEDLKTVVETDCKLFGYDIEPYFVFDHDFEVEFDYFRAVDF